MKRERVIAWLVAAGIVDANDMVGHVGVEFEEDGHITVRAEVIDVVDNPSGPELCRIRVRIKEARSTTPFVKDGP